MHSNTAAAGGTDWEQILQLYDQLLVHVPTPVVALHRAVAVAEVHGPAAGLGAVDLSTFGTTTCSIPPGPTSSAALFATVRLRRSTGSRCLWRRTTQSAVSWQPRLSTLIGGRQAG